MKSGQSRAQLNVSGCPADRDAAELGETAPTAPIVGACRTGQVVRPVPLIGMGKKQPTVWKLEPHTRAKHDLLRKYLDAWYPIITGGVETKINYIDGFSGPGIYEGGEDGSPIIALKALLEHPNVRRRNNVTFNFVFLDEDAERVETLRERIAVVKAANDPWPANIKVHAEREQFADAMTDLFGSIGPGKVLAPTFALIDPFGVKGLPMTVIEQLCAFPKAEVFINFMTNTGERFAGKEWLPIDQHFEQLFGTDEYFGVNEAEDRGEFLLDLYIRQLKGRCGMKFVRSFEMVNDRGKSYDMVYATKHILGLKVMKDAMWKVDNRGLMRFSDREIGVIDMFGGDDNARLAVKELLPTRLAGRTMSIDQIQEYVLAETPYTSKHISKPLTALERGNGLANVSRPGRWGFPKGTVVTFRK